AQGLYLFGACLRTFLITDGKFAKKKLSEHIQFLGKEREVFHLYNNMWDLDLHLDYFVNGNEYSETLAEADGHGRWFKWKL
uniref:DUF2332 family protein n=1 Tax=Paenibacillus tyrfis TaxID=1501230 RepID=UPI00117DC60A